MSARRGSVETKKSLVALPPSGKIEAAAEFVGEKGKERWKNESME